jgi:hypothetical protein
MSAISGADAAAPSLETRQFVKVQERVPVSAQSAVPNISEPLYLRFIQSIILFVPFSARPSWRVLIDRGRADALNMRYIALVC